MMETGKMERCVVELMDTVSLAPVDKVVDF